MPEQCILYVVSGAVIGMESCESYLSIICQTKGKKKKCLQFKYRCRQGMQLHTIITAFVICATLWLEFILCG